MSLTPRVPMGTASLAAIILAAVLVQASPGDSYVYLDPVSVTEGAAVQAATPTLLHLPPGVGSVAAEVTAFGYAVGEGGAQGEFVYVRLAVVNSGDRPFTVDPAGAALTDDQGRRIIGASLYSGQTPLSAATVAPGGRDELCLGFALAREMPLAALGSAVVEWPYAYGDERSVAATAFLKGASLAAAPILGPERIQPIASYPSEAFAPITYEAGVPVIVVTAPRTEVVTTYVEYSYITPPMMTYWCPVYRPWHSSAYGYFWSNDWCIPTYNPYSPWRWDDGYWDSGFSFGVYLFGGHRRDRDDHRRDDHRGDDRRGGDRDVTVVVNNDVTVNIGASETPLDRAAIARQLVARQDATRDLEGRESLNRAVASRRLGTRESALTRTSAAGTALAAGTDLRAAPRQDVAGRVPPTRPIDTVRKTAQSDSDRRAELQVAAARLAQRRQGQDPKAAAPSAAPARAADVRRETTAQAAAPRLAEAQTSAARTTDRAAEQRREQLTAAAARLAERRAAAAPRVETPRVAPVAPKVEAPRVAAAAPRVETPRVAPVAPKVEAPRVAAAAPRVETPRVTPVAPRAEAPRVAAAAPRAETPRVTPVAPRVEAPRVAAPAPRVETPRVAPVAPRVEAPRVVAPAPRIETPRVAPVAPRAEAPRVVAPAPRVETPRVAPLAPRVEVPRVVAPAPRIETPRVVAPAPRVETPRVAPVAPRVEAPRVVAPAPRVEAPRVEAPARVERSAPTPPRASDRTSDVRGRNEDTGRPNR